MTFFQSLFSFKGRLNRAKYWLLHILLICISALVELMTDGIAPAGDSTDEPVGYVLVLLLLAFMAILGAWSIFAVTVKRWHDRDKSGWWILIHLIPIFGSIYALVQLGFLKGTKGYNRFGPDPLK